MSDYANVAPGGYAWWYFDAVSDDGRYAWTAVITPYTPPDSTPGFDTATTTMAVRLWKLALTVTWPGTAGSERSVALSTVRLAAKG